MEGRKHMQSENVINSDLAARARDVVRAGAAPNGGGPRGRSWRVWVWGVAGLLLLLPAALMVFTDEVAWGPADFGIFGGMLLGACGTLELAARGNYGKSYRAAVAVAIATAFLLVWMNLAVGIIGDESNPANWMYGGVLAVAMVGAWIARFWPRGMARVLAATAFAQLLVPVISLAVGLGSAFVLSACFAALWLTSALLFRNASVHQYGVMQNACSRGSR